MPVLDECACVLPLGDPAARDRARAGGKAATLAALAADGFPVPDAMVLTAAALDAVCDRAGLGPRPSADEVRLTPLPPPVVAALESIAAHFGDTPVAVRSSAVAEDLPDASYAGQYDTVLNVVGLTALREAVRRCWASAFGARVRGYRDVADDRAAGPPRMAVLVQQQVDADSAGVAFTADPVTGESDAVRVSAVPGLGDALVSGAVEPDEWAVAGTAATPVRVVHQALAEAQAREVAALALRVERALGVPQDIEWAMAGGQLMLLQARPITALPVAPVVELPPGTWMKDADRHPEPLTALGAAAAAGLVSRGLTAMSASCGGLIERFEMRTVGGEPYMQVTPIGGRGGPPPPWWVLGLLARLAPPLRRRMRTARRVLAGDELARLQRQWDEEWRPELERTFDRLHAVDLAALDDAALIAHLDDVLAVLDRAMDIHFRLIPPYLIPIHTLTTTCSRLLGWTDAETLQLLAGASPATSAPARDMSALGARVRANPLARAAVADPAADARARLRAADAELGAEFDDWCRRYGRRTVNDDPGSPLLVELPGVLAALLRDCVAGRDVAAAARGAEQLRAARERLAEAPAAEQACFEAALADALRVYPLREDSAFWTGSMTGGAARLAALEIGRRLAARGVLSRADDAVHLDPGMLRAALGSPAPDAATLRAAAAQARAERAWVRAHPGPPFRGDPPTPFPDLRGLPRAGRRMNEALLWMQRRPPRPSSADADVLTSGVAAAAGRYTGPVRIVNGVADFARLQPGEVLVCPTTDPAWTVLFGIAGALVTDGGGVLSHAAIVAREHAIPAVVGTGDATTVLRDGQVVTVDGTAGTVHAAVAEST